MFHIRDGVLEEPNSSADMLSIGLGLSSSPLAAESSGCVPSSCSEEEVEIVLSRTLAPDGKRVDVYSSKAKVDRPDLDTADIIFMYMISSSSSRYHADSFSSSLAPSRQYLVCWSL